VVLGGGVPLVGPQEELLGTSGYTPDVKILGFYNNKQANKKNKTKTNNERSFISS